MKSLKVLAALYVPANDYESALPFTDFGVTNKFYRVGEFANMESVNNED